MTRSALGRRKLGLALAAASLLVASVLTVVAIQRNDVGGDDPGIAGDATVEVSSADSDSSPAQIARSDGGQAEWRSDEETVGAWIELTWPQPKTLRRIVLERDTLDRRGIEAGFLTFGDGSRVHVGLSDESRTTLVPVTPRQTDSVRFTVSAVGEGATSVALTDIAVFDIADGADVSAEAAPDGNVAAEATLSSSSGGEDTSALVDAGTDTSEIGRSWTMEDPAGGWVQLEWDRPRELTTLAIAGGAASGTSTLRQGTVEFSDGSMLAIGGVLSDPLRPTVVSFMPRSVTWARLTIDAVEGSGPLELSELSAYRRGASALGADGASDPVPEPPAPTECEPPGDPAPGPTGLVVLCPLNGTEVSGPFTLQARVGTAVERVTATIWPGDLEAGASAPVSATPTGDGLLALDLDVGDVTPGPFTVALKSSVRARPPVFLQLVKEGPLPSPSATSDGATRGRSLVYAEEFDRPLSISSDGAGADYSAAKPTDIGVESFGDAGFADPATGRGPATADGYLGMPVRPLADGSGLEAGLLASARPGGSGFSAQYGYFEARMLAPASLGTWPAFWMLPAPNLVAPLSEVAEIDAVELYGHEPLGACHSTHEYVAGEDGGVASCGARWATARDALAWHTYGVDVGPGEIVFFIDGQEVARAPQVRGGGVPLFFLADLALGGGWPVDLGAVQDRADLYVDYIRVYV